MSNFIKKLIKYYHDQKGATLIEFAIVAPIFLTLIFAIIEFSLISLRWFALDNGLNESSQLSAMIATSDSDLAGLILENSFGFMEVDGTTVCSCRAAFATLGDAVKAEVGINACTGTCPASSGATPQTPGVYVLHVLSNEYDMITPLAPMINMLGGDSFDDKISLSSSTVIRNQEFE
jgi:Flp pilus assembly protein TadG